MATTDFFFKVFVSQYSSVSLLIPIAYYDQLPRLLSKTAILKGPGGRSWNVAMKIEQEEVYFEQGWPRFVEENNLSDGDYLTLVYNGDRNFEVSIHYGDYTVFENAVSIIHEGQNSLRRNNQFAVVENPGFWNWTFTVKDADGEVLAQIDRDWRGFGFEIFTDAGQYVIRFGKADAAAKTGPATMIEELEVKRPLTLSERAVVLTLAISLDNDYFSRHGWWLGSPIHGGRRVVGRIQSFTISVSTSDSYGFSKA